MFWELGYPINIFSKTMVDIFFRRRHFAEKEESDLNIFLSLQALIFAGEVIENPECDISDGAVSSQNVLLTFRVFKLDLDIKMHFS